MVQVHTSYSTGYRPDPASYRRTSFAWLARRLGLSASPPASVSLAPYMPRTLDQNGCSGCTGHATAAAIYAAFAAKGQPLSWVPSPKDIYTLGRAIDRASPSDPLLDNGAEPNQVFRAIDEFGIRPMKPLPDRYSDADPATINDEPDLASLEQDGLTIVSGDYAIADVGQAREDQVCMALASGRPVCCAIAGSGALQSYTGGVLGPLGTDLDHYVLIFAADAQPDGSRVYTLRNSWGASYGEAGNFRINSAALAELGDLVVADCRLGGQ